MSAVWVLGFDLTVDPATVCDLTKGVYEPSSLAGSGVGGSGVV